MNEGFMREFIYGDDEPRVIKEEAFFSCTMTKKTEGWIDLPHGGFSMGLLTDLAFRLLDTSPPYPLTLTFRLGGSRVRIGDAVDFTVSLRNENLEGHGTVQNQPFPYIEFSGRPGSSADHDFDFPKTLDCEEGTPLPTYRNCLVCGSERLYPGLRRKFFFLEEFERKPVLSPVSANDADFFLFSQDGTVHPLPLLALLDEILGWGGFMITASGAVTVSLQVVLHRPIKLGEELTFFGYGGRVRGSPGRRLIFWATGGVLVKSPSGANELVATAEGQYFGLEMLTRQMKEHLLPPSLAAQAFMAAGGAFP